jgi:hypothetical protein
MSIPIPRKIYKGRRERGHVNAHTYKNLKRAEGNPMRVSVYLKKNSKRLRGTYRG